MAKVAAVVPAGGRGTRLGHHTPKQFLKLGGVPILTATVRVLARHPAITVVVVAAPAAHVARTARALAMLGPRVTVVTGGATRQESVGRALQATPADTDLVLIHDAVRPFITRRLIDTVLTAARAHGAAVCALPIAETVKRVSGELITETLDRAQLVTVQTPQAFRAPLLREAHEKAQRDGFVGTDDAMLVERLGHAIQVVPGSPSNVKITTPADLKWARGRQRG